MQRLKKIFFLIIFFTLFVFLPPTTTNLVNAQGEPPIFQSCQMRINLSDIDPVCTDEAEVSIEDHGICCFINSLYSVTDWLFYFLLLFAAIFIIIAGYYFATATGNTENINTAKKMVLYSLIGVFVAILAKGLVSLIITVAAFVEH